VGGGVSKKVRKMGRPTDAEPREKAENWGNHNDHPKSRKKKGDAASTKRKGSTISQEKKTSKRLMGEFNRGEG